MTGRQPASSAGTGRVVTVTTDGEGGIMEKVWSETHRTGVVGASLRARVGDVAEVRISPDAPATLVHLMVEGYNRLLSGAPNPKAAA